jgi:hypothetical protein
MVICIYIRDKEGDMYMLHIGSLLETMTNNDNRNKGIVGDNIKPSLSVTGDILHKPKESKAIKIDGRSRSSFRFHPVLDTSDKKTIGD